MLTKLNLKIDLFKVLYSVKIIHKIYNWKRITVFEWVVTKAQPNSEFKIAKLLSDSRAEFLWLVWLFHLLIYFGLLVLDESAICYVMTCRRREKSLSTRLCESQKAIGPNCAYLPHSNHPPNQNGSSLINHTPLGTFHYRTFRPNFNDERGVKWI